MNSIQLHPNIVTINSLADNLLGWQEKDRYWYIDGFKNTDLQVATSLSNTRGFFRPDKNILHSRHCLLTFKDRFFLKLRTSFKGKEIIIEFVNTFDHYKPGSVRAVYRFNIEDKYVIKRCGINEYLLAIEAYLKLNRINKNTPFYQNKKDGTKVIEVDFTSRSFDDYLKYCSEHGIDNGF